MADDKARVSIIDQTSGKKWSVILPTNVTASQLRPALVRQLGLTTEGPGGAPQQYYLALDGESGATRLGEEETLSAAGVQEGAILRITPMMTGELRGAPGEREFYERVTRARPEAEIDLAKIMVTEALLVIQKHLVGDGWSLGGKRTTASGEVQHARRPAPGGGTLDLYVLVTPATAFLQLFVAGARPECRLGLYKYLLALNGRDQESPTRWTTDAHDQIFVGVESPADLIQIGVNMLLDEFQQYGAEAAALAQDARLSDLVLRYGQW